MCQVQRPFVGGLESDDLDRVRLTLPALDPQRLVGVGERSPVPQLGHSLHHVIQPAEGPQQGCQLLAVLRPPLVEAPALLLRRGTERVVGGQLRQQRPGQVLVVEDFPQRLPLHHRLVEHQRVRQGAVAAPADHERGAEAHEAKRDRQVQGPQRRRHLGGSVPGRGQVRSQVGQATVAVRPAAQAREQPAGVQRDDGPDRLPCLCRALQGQRGRLPQ